MKGSMIRFRERIFRLMLAASVMSVAFYGFLLAQAPELTKVATVPVNAAQAHDVALVGNRAYVATSVGLTIFDITEITAPVMLGYVFHGGLDGPCTGLEGTPCTHCEEVAVEGKYAYLACSAKGLLVVDVSDPTAPVIVAQDLPRAEFTDSRAIAIKDNTVFLVDFGGYLYVYDVSNPLAPVQARPRIGIPSWSASSGCGNTSSDASIVAGLEALSQSGGGKGTGVSINGNFLVTTEWNYGRSHLYDITDPVNPVYKGSHYFPFPLKTVTHDGWLYQFGAYSSFSGLATSPFPGGETLDEKSTEFFPNAANTCCADCAFIRTLHASYDQGDIGISSGGKYAFYGYGKWDGLIELADITNPSAPVRVATAPVGPPYHNLGLAKTGGMTNRGHYLYVASADLGLQVYHYPGLSHGPLGPRGYQGYGTETLGGAGQPVVHVTNLNDSGLGSLREALSAGNRTIVFDVAGEIVLRTYIRVLGGNITIDGFSAPAPGITIKDDGFFLAGYEGVHDVIIRGLRFRDSRGDGLTIAYGTHHIVVDHCSVDNAADGNIDITFNSHDITISNTILSGNGEEAGNYKNQLIKYECGDCNYSPGNFLKSITLHHNIYVNSRSRNPQVRMNDPGQTGRQVAQETTVDMRNNLVWGWLGGYATLAWHGPWVNIVDNYYEKSRNAISVSDGARAYVAGNVSADGVDINTVGTETQPFPAAPVDTQTAAQAACFVLYDAGVRPLDARDQQRLAPISIPGCVPPPSGGAPHISVTPASLVFAAETDDPPPGSQQLTVENSGGSILNWTATAGTSSGGNWLSVSPASGTAPSTLTVSVNHSGLAIGTYSGTVTIESADADNSPQTVSVTLEVQEASTTVELTISAGANDGWQTSTGSMNLSKTYTVLGKNYYSGFRFTNAAIPRGVEIISAVASISARTYPTNSITIRYKCEATGDSAPFAATSYNFTSRTMTAASVDDIPPGWTLNAYNPSPELKTIVQEVINRSDWTSGNALSLFILDNGSSQLRYVNSYENSPSTAVKLTVRYRGTPPPPTPRIALTPSSLSFFHVIGNPAPSPKTLSIENAGGGTLTWTGQAATSSGGPWLSVNPASGTAPSSATVSANPAGLAIGTYQGTITISSPEADNSPQVVPVTLTVSDTAPTVEVSISSGADDGTETTTNGSIDLTNTMTFIAGSYIAGLRFANVNIPPGAVIDSAVLKMFCVANQAYTVYIRYQAEATSNSAPFTTSAYEFSNRGKTTAYVDDSPAAWVDEAYNNSPDLKTIIQEVVNRSGWQSGNSLSLFVAKTSGTTTHRRIATYETSPSPEKAAILVITYH